MCKTFLLAQHEGLIAPVYGWHAYVSQQYILEMTSVGDTVYAITEGGMFSYRLLTGEVREFTTVDGLSSIDPTTVVGDDSSHRVFIGYQDGTINYIDREGKLHFISDIARNEQFTSKRINHFRVDAGLLYIATDFGLVVYDISAKETKYAVTKVADNPTGVVVRDLAIAENKIWLAMGSLGVWSARLDDPNISYPGRWVEESGLGGLPLGTSNFITDDGQSLFAQVGDTIFQKLHGQSWTRSVFDDRPYNFFNSAGGNVFATYPPDSAVIRYPDGHLIRLNNGDVIKSAYVVDGTVFLGDKFAGMMRFRPGIGLETVGPFGPRNNNVQGLAAHNGELYIAPSGRPSSTIRAYDKSGIPYFDLHKDGWKISDHRNGALAVGDVYQDFLCATFNPLDGHCFIGSWGEGIVEMNGGEVVRTYTAANSGLTPSAPGHLVGDMAVDDVGNLWIVQAINDYPLNMKTPDGQWMAYQAPYNMLPWGIMIDDLGNKWIIDKGTGIVIFNDNFTPEILSDDRWLKLTTAFGNGNLPNSTVNAIVQDDDLQVWIGTNEGMTILYDPSLLWTSDFQDAACPIIDGYCLLRDQQVNDIAVDGYNRKWIATENGVYLVNLDGTELLEHFTSANSPLFDNRVRSLTIDGTTGEIFFGTSKGVVSYVGDAIDGLPDAENLYAYPNPIMADAETPVMIKGMKKFSTVKVATASGRLVRELDSHGGEVAWDLMDSYGNRVTPGIYLLMVSDPDGKGAGITKVAIVERKN
jgi:hypothetical protein